MSGKKIHYIYVLVPRKRRTPDPRYTGTLYHYRYWIYYFFMLPDENPVKVAKNDEPIIHFPVINVGEILQFGYEIGGTKVGELPIYLKAVNREERLDIIGFESPEKYNRHLTFALIASVTKSKPRLDILKGMVLTSNGGFLHLIANIAEDAYKINKDWRRVLKVAKAVKMIYEALKER